MFDDPIDKAGQSAELSKMKDSIYYDDCPVCQVEKKAAEEGRIPSVIEMEEAMREIREGKLKRTK